MDNRDAHALFDTLEAAWIAKGRQPEQITDRVLDVWIRLLADIPLRYVERALEIHAKDASAKHPPTPADVLEIIRERTQAQWPSADEAWSIALQAMDEDVTVVWCSEIAQAWNISRPIAEEGDNIGARMAFRESYRRLVREVQEAGGEPHWEVSLGHNPMLREAPLLQAVQNKLLAHETIAHLLPGPKPEAGSLMGLLQGPGKPDGAFPVGEFLKGLKEVLLQEDSPDSDPQKEAEIERRRQSAAEMLKQTEAKS
jgi:hypothetical protein